MGFIFLAVYRLPRLPQPHNRAFASLIVGVVFIFRGFFAYKYLDQKYSVIRFRQQALALNNLYSNYPMASVKSCNINLEHTGNRIAAKVADLVVTNENEEAIDTLILSLNPSLDVKTININNKSIEFKRKMHLVFMKLPAVLKQGDDAALNIAYNGEIDERICFLDQAVADTTFIFNFGGLYLSETICFFG